MPEQTILAQDAVYVSQRNPSSNYYDVGKIKVGCYEYVTANCGSQANSVYSYENIGLVQFAPFQLPHNTRLVKITLHLFVLRSKYKTGHIWVRPTSQPFDGQKVTWSTMPSIDSDPKIPILISLDDKCSFVSCDITEMVPTDDTGKYPGFGVALSAREAGNDCALTLANQSAYPIYATIVYEPIQKPIDPDVVENVFHEYVFDLEGTDEYLCSQNILTKAAQTITYFVRNTGENILNFRLQISPDGLNFVDDKQKGTLQAGEMQAVTPYLFAKFMRVCISPQTQGELVQAQAFCQMQTHNYMVTT